LTGVPDRLNEDTENDMKSMKHEMSFIWGVDWHHTSGKVLLTCPEM
jgi:hypothetical protein